MITARRYESGRPVDDKRDSTPALGWGNKDSESRAPTSPSASSPLPKKPAATRAPAAKAKVVRRPPPAVTSDQLTDIATSAPARAEPTKAPVLDAEERIEDTSDMRKFLLKQMVRAAKGEITTETVKNVVAISQQVYNATALELKAAMILKNGDRSIRALELVSPQADDND